METKKEAAHIHHSEPESCSMSCLTTKRRWSLVTTYFKMRIWISIKCAQPMNGFAMIEP